MLIQVTKPRFHGASGGGGGGGGDVTPPSTPGTPVVVSTSYDILDVSWAPSTDNYFVSGYRLQMRLGTLGSFADIAVPSGPSFHVTGLAASTTYFFQVYARDLAGNESLVSGIGSGTTQPATLPATGSFRFGAHASQGIFYSANRNFVNLNLDSGEQWADNATNAVWASTDFGWPLAVPNGTTLRRGIRWNDPTIDNGYPVTFPSFYIKPTTYKVVCQANWTPALFYLSYGVTQLTSVPGSCTFTVNPAVTGVPARIILQVTNNSGSTQNMTIGSFACYEIAHEALWNADPFAFHPDALANYSGHTWIRFSTTNTVNAEYTWPDAASIVPKAKYMGGSWPPELQAKLCKECNASMHIQLPTFLDMMNVVVDAAGDKFVRCWWPQVEGGQYRLGDTSTTVTPTTIVAPNAPSWWGDGYLVGKNIYISSATTNAGQSTPITGYTASTKTITVASWPGGTPTGTVRFVTNPVAAPANTTEMFFLDQGGSTPLTTSASTSAGGSVLTFASTSGENVVDGRLVSGTGIPDGTYVLSHTGTTITLTQPCPSGVASSTVITFYGVFGTAVGFADVGPFRVINRDAYGFQLERPSAPGVPISVTVDNNLDHTLTEHRDYEANWTTYIQRHYNEWATPPKVHVAPFLEPWNPGYLGLFINISQGNYLHSGSRTGGGLDSGLAEFTLRAWRLTEGIFGSGRVLRAVETGISAGNSGIMDITDVNGILSLNAPMANLAKRIYVATYYASSDAPMPPWGTVNWNDPIYTTNYIVNAIYGPSPTMNEPGKLSATTLINDWNTNGPFSDNKWRTLMQGSMHFVNLHCRLWRNKMAEHGKVIGVDYDMGAYETGNHERDDRPTGVYTPGDTSELIQNSFLAWNFGNGTEVQAHRNDFLLMHEFNNFSIGMHYHLLGDWIRQNNTQVYQWGSLPFQGAETIYPTYAHYYNFLKAHT